MPKVTVTALPRQGYRGFGAIQRYFLSGVPEVVDVSDAEFKELNSDPASYFLKVEDGDTVSADAPAQDSAPSKPGKSK